MPSSLKRLVLGFLDYFRRNAPNPIPFPHDPRSVHSGPSWPMVRRVRRGAIIPEIYVSACGPLFVWSSMFPGTNSAAFGNLDPFPRFYWFCLCKIVPNFVHKYLAKIINGAQKSISCHATKRFVSTIDFLFAFAFSHPTRSGFVCPIHFFSLPFSSSPLFCCSCEMCLQPFLVMTGPPETVQIHGERVRQKKKAKLSAP